MSVPGNINPAPPPSSFDEDSEFYEESRMKKLKRKVFEEPLIPLGCALTCWALFEATRSMRSGDKYKTNRMFRRRIYAQGFTVLAMLGGSIYWESDRSKRKQYNGLVEEKKKKEKHEAWLRELEARADEEEELKKIRSKIIQGQAAERRRLTEGDKRGVEAGMKDGLNQSGPKWGDVKCVDEASDLRTSGAVMAEVRRLWDARR